MAKIFVNCKGQQICLASASPRRKELLESAGLDFFILKTGAKEEEAHPSVNPENLALLNAQRKAVRAREILNQHEESPTIIACDTIVCLEENIFGKPDSQAELAEMLYALNGRKHLVISGVAFIWPNAPPSSIIVRTEVTFAAWPKFVLEAYACSCRPLDKAGGYGIQDGGGFLASGIEGSYTNVVGLPLAEVLCELLRRGIIEPARA